MIPEQNKPTPKMPAVPGSLSYFMQKAKATGKGNVANRAYTMYKRSQQAKRRGSTPAAGGKPSVFKSDSSVGQRGMGGSVSAKSSGSSKAGQAAAAAGAAAAVGAGAMKGAKVLGKVRAEQAAEAAKRNRAAAAQKAKATKAKAAREAAKARAPESAARNTDYTVEQGRKVDSKTRGATKGTDTAKAGRATSGARSPRTSPAEANARSAQRTAAAGRQTPNSGPNARFQTLTGRRFGGLFGLRSK